MIQQDPSLPRRTLAAYSELDWLNVDELYDDAADLTAVVRNGGLL